MQGAQPEGNFYDKYNSKNPIVKYIMRGFFNAMDGILGKLDFSSVYEAGCGEGMVSEHIYSFKNGNVEYHASDFSAKVIEQAKTDCPHIHFSVDSIYELPCADESYDLVVASEVLEHLEYPEKAIKELFRIAKKYVLISVPNEPIWRISNMLRGKYFAQLGNTPGHIQHWNSVELLKTIDEPLGGGGGQLIKPFPWIMVLYSK